FQEVAVARQPPHLRAAVEAKRLPSEQRPVEDLCALGVARVEAVEAQRAGLVDDARAPVVFRLPDGECGALWIGEHRHPARVHDIEWVREYAPAGLPYLRGGLVRALHPHVRVPYGRRRRALGL